MVDRIKNRVVDTESVKDATREWGLPYAIVFSLQSLVYTAIALWFGITDPPDGGFYPAFKAILRDVGIAGLASVVSTTTIMEGAQSIMIIAATYLKPRERRIREEGRAKGREEGREEGLAEGMERGMERGVERGIEEGRAQAERTLELERAQAERALELERAQAERALELERAQAERTLALERAEWRVWYQRSELAREMGEEPPPPPFFDSENGQSP